MRIFLFLGHEVKDKHVGRMADAYEKAARDAGHEVRRMNISDMKFDPILHHSSERTDAMHSFVGALLWAEQAAWKRYFGLCWYSQPHYIYKWHRYDERREVSARAQENCAIGEER